ncbi:MAG: ABC transporter permease [Candidatus Heimdallarchaeaceae archaeon]
MEKEKHTHNQLKSLLKKDLSLLFRKKVAFFIFGGPFILMFILIGLPALFGSEQAVVMLVYSDDVGVSNINIGSAIIGNLTQFFTSDPTLEIQIVENFTAVQQTEELGYYIPANFTELVFTGIPVVYTVDASQSPFTDSYFNAANSIASSVVASFLANRTIPEVQKISLPPASLPEEQQLGPKASAIAMPLSYMIFLLIALNSGSNSLIGFAREKRMRTMEVLLAYTHNHSFLVISKAITGLVASLGSTLSYFLGIWFGSSLVGKTFSGDIFSLFGFHFESLGIGSIVISFFSVVLALLISTLLTMLIDVHLNKEIAERISPLASVGFAMFFYFVVLINPLTLAPALLINPFYWCYRLSLLVISGKFNLEILLYLALIIGSIVGLIYLSTRGIEKERNLYLD